MIVVVDRTLFVGLPLGSDVVAVCASTEEGEGVTEPVQEENYHDNSKH